MGLLTEELEEASRRLSQPSPLLRPCFRGLHGARSPTPMLPPALRMPCSSGHGRHSPHAGPRMDGWSSESLTGALARRSRPAEQSPQPPGPTRCPLDEALPLGGCWRAGQEWSHPPWPTASSGPGRLPNRQETTPALGRTPGSSMPAMTVSPSSDRTFISFSLLWGKFLYFFSSLKMFYSLLFKNEKTNTQKRCKKGNTHLYS